MDNEAFVNVNITVSNSEKIDTEKIKQCLSIGRKNVTAVKGRLKTSGLYYPAFGDVGDSIEVAIACIEVGIK